MAKSIERLKAQSLRRRGVSIKDIARLLGVSKGSVSLWCQNIQLSPHQQDHLHAKMIAGAHKGRVRAAQLKRAERESRVRMFERAGQRNLATISKRDLLLMGIGLYLGEGSKASRKFQFTNSNPDIVRLCLRWLERCFGIERRDLILTVFINESHRYRHKKVLQFWVRTTGVKLYQFRKTIFIKVKNKKIYSNANDHFGTLSIRARRSTDLQYRILGLCYGLLTNVGIMKPR
jgi:DNA-binding transcriptional regulator YdaS (Cro superfamily)